jgi:hypothetical protein
LKSAKSLSLHRVARKAKTALTSSFCQVQEFGSYKEIIQTPARTEILCTRESGVEHLLDGRIDRPISTGQYRQANIDRPIPGKPNCMLAASRPLTLAAHMPPRKPSH